MVPNCRWKMTRMATITAGQARELTSDATKLAALTPAPAIPA
jgi:hypothetical protein